MKKEMKTLKETQAFAEEFIKKTLKTNYKKATVVALYGDLGSGKTSFVQGIAKALGVSNTVISPTFVIERIYKISKKHFSHLIHIDAYRLENKEELLSLGWEEIISNPENIIFVEWAERVKEILPNNVIKIEFEYIDENRRSIEIINN